MKLSEIFKSIPLYNEGTKKRIAVFAISVAFLVAAFFGGGWYFNQAPEVRHTVETKVEFKDRVVEVVKTVEVVRTVVEKQQVVKWKERIVEVVKPDGTKTVVIERTADSETKEEEKKTESLTSEKKTDKESSSSSETKEELVQKPHQPEWRAQVAAGVNLPALSDLTKLQQAAIYGVGVERRIIGPFWVGLRVDTTQTGSLTISAEF